MLKLSGETLPKCSRPTRSRASRRPTGRGEERGGGPARGVARDHVVTCREERPAALRTPADGEAIA